MTSARRPRSQQGRASRNAGRRGPGRVGAEHCHAGAELDAVGAGGDAGQHGLGRRDGCTRAVVLTEREGVDADLVGEDGLADDLADGLRVRDRPAGVVVRDVAERVQAEEEFDTTGAPSCAGRGACVWVGSGFGRAHQAYGPKRPQATTTATASSTTLTAMCATTPRPGVRGHGAAHDQRQAGRGERCEDRAIPVAAGRSRPRARGPRPRRDALDLRRRSAWPRAWPRRSLAYGCASLPPPAASITRASRICRIQRKRVTVRPVATGRRRRACSSRRTEA